MKWKSVSICFMQQDGFACHVDSTNVVTIDNRRLLNRDVKLWEKLLQPTVLNPIVSHDAEFCFGTRARHHNLVFGGSGHYVVTKKDSKANVERHVSGQPTQLAFE